MARELDTDRKKVYEYNDPLLNYSKYGGIYNPLLYPVILADMFIVLLYFMWHRYQSMKARRGDVHRSLGYAISRQRSIYHDHDKSKTERRRAQETIEHLLDVADEMNIQSDTIESVREEFRD